MKTALQLGYRTLSVLTVVVGGTIFFILELALIPFPQGFLTFLYFSFLPFLPILRIFSYFITVS